MFRARSFEAERFTDWVTREVLPTIRRTGQYGGFQIPQNYAEALQVAADQAKRADEAEAALAIAAPKAETYDRYLGADGCHTMGTAAKILGTGRTRLFQWLRAQKIVPPKRTIPYQQYIEAGYFVIRAQTQERTDGTVSTFDAAAVTPKGLDWLQRKLNGLLEGIK
jgi:phage antirepressor YoqD-like protein